MLTWCDAAATTVGDVTYLGKCVDLETDADNCGSCGYLCPRVANAVPTCERTRCNYECVDGFADCNGRPDDGCEANLAKDPHHCGGCDLSCDNAIGQPCVKGQCVTAECDGGTLVQ
jgi:hypothetical protein